MAMIQEQQHIQTLRQEQSLTQQQIQALEMLAAPILDLQQIITKELEKNPVLEAESGQTTDTIPSEEQAPNPENENQEWIEQLLKLDDTSPYQKQYTRHVSPEEEERRRHYLESISIHETLQEKLEEQLRFLNLPANIRKICDIIIAGLDDDGYLLSHPADIAMACGESMEIIEKAIKTIQSCEPAGIGARNLKERLMLQLERQGKKETFVYFMVENYLQQIASNKILSVIKELDISMDTMRQVIEEIKSLTPHLSIDQGEDPREYIEEEVTIIEKQDEFDIILNNQSLPRLRISSYYKQLLANPNTPKEAKLYIREKIRGAAFLISSLTQRQSTLERIVRAIVEVQKNYFQNGMQDMRPLTMAQIAQLIGVHETTVSRGVAGKYLRCKHGLMPLKKFFTTGYENEAGQSISNLVVKNRIQTLIKKENSSKPLSDSQISKELSIQGLKVARRTVAKYRESMGILSSNLRRQYW